jgi:hypothetical protein
MLKASTAWNGVFYTLKENSSQPRSLQPRSLMMHLKLPEKQYEAKLRITRAEINGMETKKINTKNQ